MLFVFAFISIEVETLDCNIKHHLSLQHLYTAKGWSQNGLEFPLPQKIFTYIFVISLWLIKGCELQFINQSCTAQDDDSVGGAMSCVNGHTGSFCAELYIQTKVYLQFHLNLSNQEVANYKVSQALSFHARLSAKGELPTQMCAHIYTQTRHCQFA